MGRFMLKCFLLFSLLLLGVIAGMQYANMGMHKMKGYQDPELTGAATLYQGSEGEVKASILGTVVTEEQLSDKQKKLEELTAFNLFSQMGKQAAGMIEKGTRALLNSAGEAVGKMFDKG